MSTDAYLFFSFTQTESMKNFGEYASAADALLAKYGGELIVAGADAKSIGTFEGEWPENAGLTLIRFPSRKHLDDFWNSDEYQSIVELRIAILKPNFTIAF